MDISTELIGNVTRWQKIWEVSCTVVRYIPQNRKLSSSNFPWWIIYKAIFQPSVFVCYKLCEVINLVQKGNVNMHSVWNTCHISLTSQNTIIKSLPLFWLCVPPSFIFPLFKLSFDKCNRNTAVLLLAVHLSPSLILFPSYPSSTSPALLLLPRSGSLLTLSCQCRERERVVWVSNSHRYWNRESGMGMRTSLHTHSHKHTHGFSFILPCLLSLLFAPWVCCSLSFSLTQIQVVSLARLKLKKRYIPKALAKL